MTRQSGYKQVSLTPEAYRALQLMTYGMSASVAEKVTLSQAVRIAEKVYNRSSEETSIILECAQEIGIEPPIDVS
jgi:hypothetical protein